MIGDGLLSEHRPNREYKASLFVSLFGEPKKMLELYNALSGADYPPDTPVEVATLGDALFMDRINDLAFVVDNKLVILVEHQSTINENMPLRFLIYLGRIYEKMVDSRMLYRRKLVGIPAPDFFVLYNGDNNLPERSVLKLSDAFDGTPEFQRAPLELEATVYNVNRGHNAALLNRSETLYGYVRFIEKIKSHIAAGFGATEAFTKTIRECIDEGILESYLKKNGSEVINMLTQEWDWGKALEVSFLEGKDDEKIETAHRMLAGGLNVGDISMYTGLPVEKIKSLKPLAPKADGQPSRGN